MLDLALSSRGIGRLLVGALVLACALLAAVVAVALTHRDAPELRLVERVGQGSAASRTGLADNRPAHVRRHHVAARRIVVSARRSEAAGEPPQTPHGGARLVAAVAPATDAHSGQDSAPPVAPETSPVASPGPPPTSPPEPSPPPEPTPTPPTTTDGEVLFWATFESGDFSGWYVQSLPDRASTSSTEPFEGVQAARFEVQDGDVEPDTGSERSEISGPTFYEGEDLFIRDAIRVPGDSTYDGPWQIVQQLHEHDWGGSPGIAVFLNSEPALQLGAGDGSPTYWRSGPLQPDRWYDLVYRVYLSQGSSAGFVEVWLDGVQQTLLNGQTRAYGQTIQTSRTYIKAGIYRSRSSTGTSLVEHDAIVIGTSLAAVMAF